MIKSTDKELLIELSNKLHWLRIAEDGVPELYLDNHMMQIFRACEARFELEMIRGVAPKGVYWFLQFGTLIHEMIEYYYLHRNESSFNSRDWAINLGTEKWNEYKMDDYRDHPKYKELGGCLGFVAMLAEYSVNFNAQNERLRTIATEIYFGKNKEVPLLENPREFTWASFRLYLCGKIDLLIDDGYSICPMDHKTVSDFRGKNPIVSYEIQDGMTGYVFAARHIVRTLGLVNAGAVNKIIMNFLQVKAAKNNTERFKRLPLYKTDEQLAQYRMRMIATASQIFNILISKRPYQWNTFLCNNWMHQECSYNAVHRLNSFEDQERAINTLYSIKPIWNPEKI